MVKAQLYNVCRLCLSYFICVSLSLLDEIPLVQQQIRMRLQLPTSPNCIFDFSSFSCYSNIDEQRKKIQSSLQYFPIFLVKTKQKKMGKDFFAVRLMIYDTREYLSVAKRRKKSNSCFVLFLLSCSYIYIPREQSMHKHNKKDKPLFLYFFVLLRIVG